MLSLGQNRGVARTPAQATAPAGFAARRDLMIARFFWPGMIMLGVIVYFVAALMAVGDHERATDFQIFHKVGELVWQGALGTAYDLTAFARIEVAATGQPDMTVSWAYPPQYDLVAAALGAGPIIPMYVGFILVSLVAYLWALRRLGPGRAGWTLAFAFPALMINTATGQNGFVTGGLVAWFAVLWLRRDSRAGIPLGLLIIKPHLAVGLVALTLLRRRFGIVAWAAASVVASAIVATLAFGPGVWGDFLRGAHQATSVLQAGDFRSYRIASVYTAVRSLGAGFVPAMALHLGVAAAAFAVLWRFSRAAIAEEVVLGIAVLATMLVSPYVYDYDFTIFGVALALMVPALARNLRPGATLLLWAGSWAVCGWGVIGIMGTVLGSAPTAAATSNQMPSLPGMIYPLLVFGLAWVATRRSQQTPLGSAGGAVEGAEPRAPAESPGATRTAF